MAIQHRIRSHKKASAGGGTPGTCPPTFTAPETIQRSDKLVLNPLTLRDTIQRSDRLVLNPLRLNDTLQRGDAFRMPSASFLVRDTLQRGDVATFTVGPLTAVGRSGTPDTDEWGDAWTDNTVGQTGVNHGNVSPLAMAVGVAGVGVNLAWVEINLTRFVGLTAVGNAHPIKGVFTNGSASLPSTITLVIGPSALGGGATRPFTESTITQANQPAPPGSGPSPQNLAAGAANAVLTFTLTDGLLDSILGKWALIRVSSSAGTVATPDTLVSREGTAANRMTLTFTVTR